MNTNNDRPRGVTVYKMPPEVCGPYDNYALTVYYLNENGDMECRMVHTEGVAYLVTPDKPWRWTDYGECTEYTMRELMDLCTLDNAVDLADWVRVFGARLESNFHQIYAWATH